VLAETAKTGVLSTPVTRFSISVSDTSGPGLDMPTTSTYHRAAGIPQLLLLLRVLPG